MYHNSRHLPLLLWQNSMPFQYRRVAVHHTNFQSQAHLWLAIAGTGTVRVTPFDSWGSRIWGTVGMDPSWTSSIFTWGHSEIAPKNISETGALWYFALFVVKNPRSNTTQISRSSIWMNINNLGYLCTSNWKRNQIFSFFLKVIVSHATRQFSTTHALSLTNLVICWYVHSDQWQNNFRFIPQDLLLIHKAEYYPPNTLGSNRSYLQHLQQQQFSTAQANIDQQLIHLNLLLAWWTSE